LGCNSYAKTQYKIYWISMQSVTTFICLLQVGGICTQYSHGYWHFKSLFIICYCVVVLCGA